PPRRAGVGGMLWNEQVKRGQAKMQPRRQKCRTHQLRLATGRGGETAHVAGIIDFNPRRGGEEITAALRGSAPTTRSEDQGGEHNRGKELVNYN
ncbi:hypothetical protein HDU96_005115, partial [Phlyctochytrium bullatum]